MTVKIYFLYLRPEVGLIMDTKKTTVEICEAIALDFKARKITHQQAGDSIGKSKAVISNQISGKKPFSKSMAILFSRAFGYNIRFLLYGEGELCGDVVRDVVEVPITEGPITEDVVLFASLIDVAEGILRVVGDQDALDAWYAINNGDYDNFLSSMKALCQAHRKAKYIPIAARFICEKIKDKGLILVK